MCFHRGSSREYCSSHTEHLIGLLEAWVANVNFDSEAVDGPSCSLIVKVSCVMVGREN